MKRVFDVAFICEALHETFVTIAVADDEQQAREQAKAEADGDCNAKHTVTEVEEVPLESDSH